VHFRKFMGFFTFLEVPHRIVHISEFLMGLCTFWKFLLGYGALFEVNHGILCIFGRSSWDIVHIWKFLMGFCAFLEVPHIILCIFGSSSCDFVHFWNFLMAKHTHVHFILSLFLYKIRVFTTCILIDCGYRWLQPVQNVIL
jgi:hypothetical protein